MIISEHIMDEVKLKEYLAKEDIELSEALKDFDINTATPEETREMMKRFMKFVNSWNYHNVHFEHEQVYICPEVKQAIVPMKCMLCSYGHMAFDCHFPFTCDSEYCNHYDHRDN